MTDSELIILSFIKDGLNYPYIMEKIIDTRDIRDFFELSFSSIYYLINQLEKKHLIETYTAYSNRGIHKKGVRITEEGRKELEKSAGRKFKARPLLSHPLDYSLYNCHQLTSEELKKGIATYMKEVQIILKFYEQKIEEDDSSDIRIPLGERLILTHTISRLRAEAEWIKELRSYINSIQNLDTVLKNDRTFIEELYRSMIFETQ